MRVFIKRAPNLHYENRNFNSTAHDQPFGTNLPLDGERATEADVLIHDQSLLDADTHARNVTSLQLLAHDDDTLSRTP